jgi:ATP-binding cassette, subfamily B, bacterial
MNDLSPLLVRHENTENTPAYLRSPGPFILHYLASRRRNLAALVILVIGAGSCGIGGQYAIKLLVDAMNAGPGLTHGIYVGLALLLTLVAVESVLWRGTGWLTCRTTLSVGVDLRLNLFDYLSGQSMRYFAENVAGSIGQRITSSAGNLGALTNTFVWRVLPPIVDFAGAIVLFSMLDVRMIAALGCFVVLVTAGLVWFGERGRPLHRNYSGAAANVAGDLIDVISNMWTVKAFSARAREWHRLRGHFEQEAVAQRRSWMYLEKARLLHDVALWVMAGTMLIWAVSLWNSGRITPGDVILVSTLTFRILHSSKDMALALIDMAQQFGFIEETLAVIGQPRTVCDVTDAKPLSPGAGSITFENVAFAYPGRSEVIHRVNLHIPAGQKVGIVGASGAGKSTLVHLVQRLHDVHAGSISIDGQNIAAATQDTLRAVLAVVPQEISLLHRSIMDNIRFARPDARDEEVFAAARAAACDFIDKLPDGYHTIVGERGIRLSGGQRQRVGIARALLKNAPIIIFDEATSSLDTESEIRVLDTLVHAISDRTVISVAHRLSTLTKFDRIIVLERGKIVEDGSIAELRRRGGVFERMWRAQVEGLTGPPEMERAA